MFVRCFCSVSLLLAEDPSLGSPSAILQEPKRMAAVLGARPKFCPVGARGRFLQALCQTLSCERGTATMHSPMPDRCDRNPTHTLSSLARERGSAPEGGRHSTILVDPQWKLRLSSVHLCSGSPMV